MGVRLDGQPPRPLDLADLPEPPADFLERLGPEEGAWASVPLGEAGQRLLLVRHHGEGLMFLNRCPHAGHFLETATGDVWDRRRRHLQCGSHDARFSLPDGRCISGPCRRAYLRRVRA
ncbi:MAG: Rieske (2Fe-2S) protein [Rhodothalassiaceae bacterium]